MWDLHRLEEFNHMSCGGFPTNSVCQQTLVLHVFAGLILTELRSHASRGGRYLITRLLVNTAVVSILLISCLIENTFSDLFPQQV